MLNKLTIYLLFCVGVLSAQNNFENFIQHINSLETIAEKTSAADSFITFARTRGIPYLEDTTANFIYYGNASSVAISGDMDGWTTTGTLMDKIEGINFFYKSLDYEINARLDYKLILNGSNWILDPENPNTIMGGYGLNSELNMPGYVEPWEVYYKADIQHGTLEEKQIQNGILNRTHTVNIYLPPGYDESSAHSYPTVYFQDGSDYLNLANAKNILDNLIDSSLVEPMIAVFVTPTNRTDEYAYDHRMEYAEWFATVLVDSIDNMYNTSQNKFHRLVMGDSFGGNISALISYNYPEVFANCGLHSAAFHPNNYEVYNLIRNGEKKDIKYYSAWGSYESLYINMRQFRFYMLDKGYIYEWAEYPEGHSWGLWKATTDDILIWFFPPGVTSVEEDYINDNDIHPTEFSLRQNYPNPFNPGTTIEFRLANYSLVKLEVFNLLGEKISTLVNNNLKEGNHKFYFDGSSLNSGVYFYRLTTENNIITKKMTLIK